MADVNHSLRDRVVIDEFKDMLKKCTLQAACGREYVLVEKFTNWLRSKRPGSYTSYADCLLQVVYRPKSLHRPGLPITAGALSQSKDGGLLVFSILLELGRGDLVAILQRQGINDNLPIDILTLRSKLEYIKDLPDAVELADKFNQMQWRFCPKSFSLYMDRELPDSTVIPIHKKEKIKTGGTAEVWMIMVVEEFVNPDLRKLVKSSGFLDKDDDLGYCYQFALKVFEESNRSYYSNEKSAFEGLLHLQGMVRYLGNYGLRQAVAGTSLSGSGTTEPQKEAIKYTYNILLEYGDLDLDDYFHDRLPPLLEIEVEAFWTAMLDIAQAVDGFHNLKAGTGELAEEYRGWHVDIKPGNILSVNGRFKLCDPGFAKFVKMTEKDDKDLKQLVYGGTETYGAPERLLAGNEAVSVLQTIDTWSLGCVFSIAATWVVLGYLGTRQFSIMRQKAVGSVIRENRLRRRPSDPIIKLNPGDYFHDGENVLTSIKDWHSVLRNTLRKNDSITSRVLDLVDEGMLLGNPEKRWKAKRICVELRRILADVRVMPREQVPQEIMDALIAVDEAADPKAETKTMESKAGWDRNLIIADQRQAHKSKRLDEPLVKTSQRSEERNSSSPPPI